MKRLLLVSPHFPPDASAGAHRARVLAPYLSRHGWTPTVLTLTPESYEGALDHELAEAVHGRVQVVRVPAWPARATRRVGVGDLGLRSAWSLFRAARRVSADAVFLTTYPIYPAACGPRLKRALGVPLVLDLQDPWVGEWGRTVGGGDGGRPDLKSRVSRALAVRLERRVLPVVDALTSVSSILLDELVARYPALAGRPRLALPIGIDPVDLDWVRARPGHVPAAPPADDDVHLCYAGTLLPLGDETLGAVLGALARLDAVRGGPRVRLHLVGTSNQADASAVPRAAPMAEALGVAHLVREWPARVPYFDVLRMLSRAGIVLVMGSTEARYTASKVQGALAAGRPLLAVVHAGSDVARQLGPLAARDPGIALVTYQGDRRAATCVDALVDVLARWRQTMPTREAGTRYAPGSTGPELAGALAALLAAITSNAARRGDGVARG